MPGPGRDVQVRLYRDSLNTPWGFRLTGGRDLNSFLTIQKVIPCTPADGELQRGDQILEIQSNDASKLTHAQAQELIKKAGGSLLLRLSRSAHVEFVPAPSVPALSQPYRAAPLPRRNVQVPVNRDFGVDYNRAKYPQPTAQLAPAQDPTSNHQRGFMLNRVNDSLSNRWSTSSPSHSSLGYYDQPTSLPITPPGQHDKYATWGSSPSISQQSIPVANAGATPWRGSRGNQAVSPRQLTRAVIDEPPAWLGSLRSSANPLSSDTHPGAAAVAHTPKVQSVHYGPDGSQEYRQAAADGVQSDTARAAHLQYNSPLGLYSRANAQEAMSGQLNGRPGEGTIGITTDTEVQRMIREEEAQKSQRGQRSKAPSATSIVQSPSVRQLESQLGVTHKASNVGISDF